ncbi:MAG: hypothetical protein CM15mP87_04700 [Candidatus Neomarinimicrobiota bacterium]|nr:MAG: hypothetical protein CM15mP87_04700 [Candidatus Neomarinimicrobiota bacterium]
MYGDLNSKGGKKGGMEKKKARGTSFVPFRTCLDILQTYVLLKRERAGSIWNLQRHGFHQVKLKSLKSSGKV